MPPKQLETFYGVLRSSPGIKPHALTVGTRHRPAVSAIHSSLSNAGTVAHLARQFRKKEGLGGSFEDLRAWQLQSDDHANFVSDAALNSVAISGSSDPL